jgi:hypothetical protein
MNILPTPKRKLSNPNLDTARKIKHLDFLPGTP